PAGQPVARVDLEDAHAAGGPRVAADDGRRVGAGRPRCYRSSRASSRPSRAWGDRRASTTVGLASVNIPVGDSRDDGPAILPSLWQFRGMVAIVVVCAGLLGFGVSQLQTTLYEAEASLLLLDSRDVSVFRDPQPQFGDPNRHVRSQAERITSLTAAARIAERLGIDDLDE